MGYCELRATQPRATRAGEKRKLFSDGPLGRSSCHFRASSPLKKSGAAVGEQSASWARREKGAYRAYSTDEQRSTTAPRAGDGGAGLFQRAARAPLSLWPSSAAENTTQAQEEQEGAARLGDLLNQKGVAAAVSLSIGRCGNAPVVRDRAEVINSDNCAGV